MSPNFRWDPKRRLNIGPYDNDFQNSEYNGEIQQRYAWRLFEEAAHCPLKSDNLMGGVWYQDHGNIEVDPAYADGLQGVKTSPGDLGLSILMGTAEGRGPLFGLSGAVGRLNRLSGRGKALYHRFPGKKSGQDFHPVFRTQGPKFSFIEIARGVEGRAFFLFQ